MVVQFESFQEADAVYVFFDVRGFTPWSRKNPGDIRRLVSILYNLADEVFESKAEAKQKRRVIKNLGDGCFCVNEYKNDSLVGESATTSFMNIIQCYHYFQLALSKSNIHGKKSLDLGFGCSYGSSHRFYTKGQSIDFVGEKVNLAARLCSKAEPGQVAFENELSGYFMRAAEQLDCPGLVVDDHSEEMKGYGQVLFSTARLQFSKKVLDRLYRTGHEELYIERLLRHI